MWRVNLPSCVKSILNSCSTPHIVFPSCRRLDGITLTAITTTENHAPAIRVYAGTLNSVTIFAGQLVGGYDCVDANDVPIGAFVTRPVQSKIRAPLFAARTL